MKKIITVLLLIVMSMGLVACGSNNAGSANVEGELEDLMSKLYEGISSDNLPAMLMNNEVTEDFEVWYTGCDDLDYKEALASESGIGSIAHSVVLIRMNEGADVESAKEEIRNNLDTYKWVCVGIEKDELVVESRGDLILVVIASSDNAEIIKTNFENL